MRVIQGIEVYDEDPAAVFEVIEKLGEGAYGHVYKCRSNDTGRLCAVKVVPSDAGMDTIRTEIEILKQCNCYNVVAYTGTYEKEGDLWIAMEFMDSGSVEDLLDLREKLKEEEIAAVAAGMVEGLAYLHSHKMIHRDIKPGNVLLHNDGAVKLADFGVSAELRATISKANTVIGSPFWMAPEVIEEQDYDNKADVWSLGISCLEMAEGEPPHINSHPMRAIFLIPQSPSPTLKQPEKWSPDFVDFLSKCLHKEPTKRSSTKELMDHPFIAKARGTAASLMRETLLEAKILEATFNPSPEESAQRKRTVKPKTQKKPQLQTTKHWDISSDAMAAVITAATPPNPQRPSIGDGPPAFGKGVNFAPDLLNVSRPTKPKPKPLEETKGGKNWAADLLSQLEDLESDLQTTISANKEQKAAPVAAPVSAPDVRGVTVYRQKVSDRTALGEVLITADTTIGELRDLIVKELGQRKGFALKRGNVPIPPTQNARKAVELFRTPEDSAVVA